ncbi:unnamed protein product [Blepharisma stoltei]|uniref:Uncharacterized protein n=1 Tax=Blepharisma stoltei TaxID=1481888 RepID=A0AAU9KC84_9CILI|nr:unnamed protein product [Blepharisma stoltei]
MNCITSRPQVLRPRTDSMMNIQPISSCINKTFRKFSFDNDTRDARNVINPSKFKQRPIDSNKENFCSENQATPKESFQTRNQKLKRPMRKGLKKYLPKQEQPAISIKNSFYEILDQVETELDRMEDLWNSVTIPHDFFSDEENII